MSRFVGEFEVGDRVKVIPGPNNDSYSYLSHRDRKDLVVLYMDEDTGYGVGPLGNDPDIHHDGDDGWLWYYPDELEAAK